MLYPTLSLLIRYISALLLGLDIRGSLALFIFTPRENISFISSNVLRRHLPPLDKLTDNFDAPNKKMERLHVSIVQHAMGIQNRHDNSNQQ